MLIYLSYDERLHHICFVNSFNIECKFSIKNFLLDEQVVELENQKRFIGTDLDKCTQILNYKEGKYLLILQKSSTLIARIINEENIVLDEVLTESKNGYNLAVAYSLQSILFYEVQTTTSISLLYQILSDDSFYKDPISILIDGKQLFEESGKLIHIYWKDETTLQTIFEYGEVIISLHSPQNSTQNQFVENENYKTIGCQQQLIYVIDFSLKKQLFEIKSNKIHLSLDYISSSHRNTSVIPEQVFYINSNIIMVYNESLIINNLVGRKFIIREAFIFVLQLLNLPIIVTFSPNRIFTLFYINSLPQYITNKNSLYIYAFHSVVAQGNNVFYAKFDQHAYSLDCPEIILKKISRQVFIRKDQKLLFYDLSKIQFGLPMYITQIQLLNKNDSINYINNSFNLVMLSQKIKHDSFVLSKGEDFVFCITEIDSNIQLSIYSSKNETLQQITGDYSVLLNLQNIYLYSQNHTIIILKIKVLSIFVYELQLQSNIFQQINAIDFKSEIIEAKQIENIVFFMLKNCTSYQFYLDKKFLGTSSSLQYQLFFSNCTQHNRVFKQGNKEILFEENKIDIKPKNSYVRSFSFQKIIDVDLVRSSLIIYELNDSVIAIKHYFFENNNLQLMYSFPTYHFIVQYPLKKIFSRIYLAIASTFQSQQYILIYKFFNMVANSLVKVIQIDNNTNFNFFYNDESIYFVHNDMVQYAHIEKQLIQFKMTSSNYYDFVQVKIHLHSYIFNKQQVFPIQFVIMNKEYKLELKNPNLKFRKNENSINLDEVSGNINDIQLIENISNCQIIKPIIILNQSLITCQSYYNGYCLGQSYNLTGKYFDQQIINLGYFEDMAFIVQVQSYENQSYAITYINKNFQLSKLKSSFIQNNQIQSQPIIMLQQQSQFLSFDKDVNQLFLFRDQLIIGFKNKQLFSQKIGQSIFKYRIKCLSDIFLTNNYYVICSKQHDEAQIVITYMFLNLTNQVDLTVNLIDDTYEIDDKQFETMKEMSILTCSEYNNVMKVEAVFYFASEKACIFEIEINTYQKKIQQLKLKNVIRYAPQLDLNSVIYADECFVILQQRSFPIDLLYIYDIKIRYNRQMIDSKYRVSISALSISRYNSSTLAMQQELQYPLFSVQLLQIGDYHIECSSNKQKRSYNILLENEISNLQTILYSEESEKLVTSNFYTFIILLMNLMAIAIILSLRRSSLTKKFSFKQLQIDSKIKM